MKGHVPGCVELTTTSTRRPTLIRTYRSFFRHCHYSGCFRVLVTIDPAYPVSDSEADSVRDFLRDIRTVDDRVCSVVVEEFPRHIGLQGALSVLFAHTRAPVGIHLEDDWEFYRDVDLNALIEDLVDQDSTQISFASDHVARGGTFNRDGEVEEVCGTRVPLRRLTAASWAANYLPLAPHVHRTDRWVPTVAKALAVSDPIRCPDERVREHVISTASRDRHNALWTKEVVVRDIGRDWLRAREAHKAIVPGDTPTWRGSLELPRDGAVPLLTRSAGYRADEARLLGSPRADPGRLAASDETYPQFLERAQGPVVWDVDGLAYVDLLCGDGAVILGHDHPAVTRTIRERTVNGLSLAPASPARVAAAGLIAKAVPGADVVHFVPTATDAVRTAVDLARRFTGRKDVVAAGPVAWPANVPDRVVDPTTVASLDAVHDEEDLIDLVAADGARIAGVLVAGPLHRRLSEGFLRRLQQACGSRGALLVLDEGLTAFRFPGGLGGSHGVTGDLVCLSHGLASGLSVAVVTGRADIMGHLRDDDGGSRSGDVLLFEVMKASLREYGRPEHYERLAATGQRMREAVDRVATRSGLGNVVHGHDQMPFLRFTGDTVLDQKIVSEMARRGVLTRTGPNFVSRAHDLDTVDVVADALTRSLALVRGS
ncbi:aminotransferase class III-fold pyridoxal phosphate-dependent enzyme [Streptomyces sp. NA02950]|uniref:aminotransferase class III-fold pyridoxal phosphate-dependent enzyme n=1 Tax=Streptomyces sp. NA02950 TaxID=2742137 RepID=UPI001592783C|nr:aminotransferase class III-fold pyridoxal phosphate-dependent enzyme [Streptomyces sp. NA02950]QKV94912.1 aminotransferase class III-fold pyridoxal phosphate-dependent enzyme [Streptomyces sp. NA02950]